MILALTGCEGADREGSPEPDVDSPGAPAPSETPAPDPPRSSPSADLRGALERLLAGSSAAPGTGERHTWFSPETAGALRSVAVDSAGHATVDFHDLRPIIPNASTSAGSASLIEELNATVFGVPGIRSAEYRMEGSCARFWEWLQYSCHTVTKESTAS